MNHPFWIGLHKLFMMIWEVVSYFCLTYTISCPYLLLFLPYQNNYFGDFPALTVTESHWRLSKRHNGNRSHLDDVAGLGDQARLAVVFLWRVNQGVEHATLLDPSWGFVPFFWESW